MSWHAVSWAKAQATGSPALKVTLMCLAEYANEYGEAWPTRERLAEDTEQSVDTVDRKLRELVEKGFISKELRRSGNRQGSSLYRLNLDLDAQRKHLRGNRLSAPPEPQDAVLNSEPQDELFRAAGEPVSEPQSCGPIVEPPLNHQEEPSIPPNPPEGRASGKILLSPSANDPVLRLALTAIAAEPPTDSGGTQRAVVHALRKLKFVVQTEAPVGNRGDGRAGRIDIVGTDSFGNRIGVELDRATMREKSLRKLEGFRGWKVGVVREGEHKRCPSGLDALVVLNPLASGHVTMIQRDSPEGEAWAAHYAAQGRRVFWPAGGRAETSQWPPGPQAPGPAAWAALPNR